MKKIYIITIYDVNKSGGLSTYVNNLNRLYLENGIDSEIITPYVNINIINNFLILFAKLIYLINKNIGLNFYYFILCYILLKILKIKFINSQNIIFHFQDVVSLFYINKNNSFFTINKILTVHGDLTNMSISDNIIKYNSKGHKYSLFIEKSGYKFADKIIAVDERLKNHVISFGINKNKVKNFPNFTDTSKFSPITLTQKNNLRKKYSFSEDKKIIFCPRRLVEKNGVIFTIDIINKLTNDFLLIITGEGPEKINILNRIGLLNVNEKVIFTGDIPNDVIKDYYNLSDLVIIPSINSNGVVEATSISAIESMSCGTPVVASNIGGLAELIIDGYNGYLCEEKNIDEFVTKINNYFNLSTNEKEVIINRAISLVKEKFSFESYFQRLKDFIF